MKAIVFDGQKAALVRDRPAPRLRDDYILVKVSYIALNPTDWKHVARGLPQISGLLGCDYSGIVTSVGPAVTKAFKPGDRICGYAHGANFSNPEDGAFAEYIVVKGDIQMHVPDDLPLEKAATIGLGAVTVAQGLYQKALRLNLPGNAVNTGEAVLIYGGSSATGSLAIQYAKLSGYTVLTTCSPNNFEFVRRLGAAQVFDYHQPNVGADINRFTQNKLRFAWDTISLPESAQVCAEALSMAPGARARYGAILGIKCPRDDVESVSTWMYTTFGESFTKAGSTTPGNKDDFEYAKMFTALTEKLLESQQLKPHPDRVGKDGLIGALRGMQVMEKGQVSGEKLVYRVEETP